MYTKRHNLIIILLIIGIVAALLWYRKSMVAAEQKHYSVQDVSQIIEQQYGEKNGFGIDESERKKIEDAGGNSTYGEIVPESLDQILSYLQLKSDDLFIDLGSGVGKVVIQTGLSTPAKAMGYELSPSRYQLAQEIKQALIKDKVLLDPSKIEFVEDNIVNAPFDRATVIFMCSTCFSDELMQKLADSIAKSPTVKYAISLRQLPSSNFGTFTLEKTFNLPMTWSANTPVYLYKVTR